MQRLDPQLPALGSVKRTRRQGKVRMEGKNYEVQDGDVVTFHFGRQTEPAISA